MKKTRSFGLNRIEAVHNLKIMSGNTAVGSCYFSFCERRKIEIHRIREGEGDLCCDGLNWRYQLSLFMLKYASFHQCCPP